MRLDKVEGVVEMFEIFRNVDGDRMMVNAL